jgi:hypothetical protein
MAGGGLAQSVLHGLLPVDFNDDRVDCNYEMWTSGVALVRSLDRRPRDDGSRPVQ